MSWNPQMDVHYQNHSMPFNSIGSFMDFFEGLTYDHVNYIFADANYIEESAYNACPATNTSIYKFAVSEPGSFSYYEYGNGYVVDNHILETDEYSGHLENLSAVADGPTTVLHGPQDHQDARDREVSRQDNIDPDNMTYEELLELGEAVGTQNRGLSQDQIAFLPTSKFKCGLFFRKKFRGERCVICQMEYKRGDKRMTLPCKHIYHTGCGRRWLSINKACPICYNEVVVDVPKH
ncbi:hypothetical protein OROGR_019588 [Orobanche gracilis]